MTQKKQVKKLYPPEEKEYVVHLNDDYVGTYKAVSREQLLDELTRSYRAARRRFEVKEVS